MLWKILLSPLRKILDRGFIFLADGSSWKSRVLVSQTVSYISKHEMVSSSLNNLLTMYKSLTNQFSRCDLSIEYRTMRIAYIEYFGRNICYGFQSTWNATGLIRSHILHFSGGHTVCGSTPLTWSCTLCILPCLRCLPPKTSLPTRRSQHPPRMQLQTPPRMQLYFWKLKPMK